MSYESKNNKLKKTLKYFLLFIVSLCCINGNTMCFYSESDIRPNVKSKSE